MERIIQKIRMENRKEAQETEIERGRGEGGGGEERERELGTYNRLFNVRYRVRPFFHFILSFILMRLQCPSIFEKACIRKMLLSVR